MTLHHSATVAPAGDCHDAGMPRSQFEPETRYVTTRGGYVAYQVFGSGPTDLLFIANWNTNLDVMWQEP